MSDSSGEGVRTLTAADIVSLVGGRLIGDPAVAVRAIAPIDRAGPGEATFLAASRYAALLAGSRASILLVSGELAETPGTVPARIVVDRPHEAILALLPRLYAPAEIHPGVHPTARLGHGVVLGRGVSIGAYVVIGSGASVGDGSRLDTHVVLGDGVVIGRECRLFPHVVAYSGTSCGDRVTLHAGVRVGSDGFGYVFRDGAHQKIPHVGRCLIESDVEIGANSTIDRGSIDDTVIGAGTKIDNLVQVGHNVRIGRACLLMSQVGIAGSARIGDGVILAGQAGVGGHLTIGDGARIGGQAGVFGSVPPGESWSGYPARPHREALRAQAALFRLVGLIRKIEQLVERGG